MRPLLLAGAISLSAFTSVQAADASFVEIWRTEGFNRPESVIVDSKRDRLIVANINGEPNAVDGNGFLSLVGMDGTVIDLHWLDGLDAPKGMAIIRDELYVADIGEVVVYNLTTGERRTIPIETASSLNDLSSDTDGTIYVSDVGANAIYRIIDGAAEPWLQDAALDYPNGILADGSRIVVAPWGSAAGGSLLSIDVATREIAPIAGAERVGNLDGVVQSGENIYFTNNTAGQVLRLDGEGILQVVATLAAGAADLNGASDMIYVPLLQDNALLAFSVGDGR